ncbi:MAG: hypothetical protein QXO70_02105 [Candidatus Pacearchaeota archaeon]
MRKKYQNLVRVIALDIDKSIEAIVANEDVIVRWGLSIERVCESKTPPKIVLGTDKELVMPNLPLKIIYYLPIGQQANEQTVGKSLESWLKGKPEQEIKEKPIELVFSGPIRDVTTLALDDFLFLEKAGIDSSVLNGIEECSKVYEEAVERVCQEYFKAYFPSPLFREYANFVKEQALEQAKKEAKGIRVSKKDYEKIKSIIQEYGQNDYAFEVFLHSLYREGNLVGYETFISALTVYGAMTNLRQQKFAKRESNFVLGKIDFAFRKVANLLMRKAEKKYGVSIKPFKRDEIIIGEIEKYAKRRSFPEAKREGFAKEDEEVSRFILDLKLPEKISNRLFEIYVRKTLEFIAENRARLSEEKDKEECNSYASKFLYEVGIDGGRWQEMFEMYTYFLEKKETSKDK